MKVVLLHTRLSGYLAACLRELKRVAGAEFLILAYPGADDAPFDFGVFGDLGEIRNRRELSDAEISDAVTTFRPDAVLTSGWADKGYMKVCRAMREQGVPVIAGCDTQWKGSLRQLVASWIAPWHVQKAIDVLWVTGERQATLARALGYEGARLWEGYYACDWNKFASVRCSVLREEVTQEEGAAGMRNTPNPTSNIATAQHFLYVGRYVDVKGIHVLVAAYREYRERVAEPWALKCAGAGPLRDDLLAAGAEDLGFVQPDELPRVMQEASAFVLPSRFEPWGVVVQEAAASGLPMICSEACGAGVHLLKSGFNGVCVPTGDADALADAMVKISEMDEAERTRWGEASFELSKQYTPERWAERLLREFE